MRLFGPGLRTRWAFAAVGLAVAAVLGWGALGLSARLVRPSPSPAAPAGWPAYGGDLGGMRHSSAAQIDADNVRFLRKAWSYSTGDMARFPESVRQSGFEATPILVESSLVFCTPFNEIVALDPATGRQKWRYDPGVSREMQPATAFVCRGVSHWRETDAAAAAGPCGSRILMGTLDGRLIAVDARDGRPCAAFGTAGAVTLDPGQPLEWAGEFGITSAPAVAGDVVVVGSAISDNRRVAAPKGTVRAYDVRSGRLLWTYDPVPRDPDDPAAASWPAGSPGAGHGNVWSTMSVDPARNLVFLPTSSPAVDFYGGDRAGDNLDTSAVVALDARTGRKVWSFQTVHHNLWDYDVPGQPGLYAIRQGGARRDVVVSATKMGMVFVLDRETGQPVFPVVERPAPQDGVPGEQLSPTQPFTPRPGLLARTHLRPQDAFGVTPWDRGVCRRKIAALRNDGLYTPPSLQGSLQFPFAGGGANWGSTAYHPGENLVVVNMNNIAASLTLRRREDVEELRAEIPEGQEIYEMAGTPYVATRALLLSPLGVPCNPPPWGELIAIDMASGEVRWRTRLGTTRDQAPLGLAFKWGTATVGGPITTAGGLVFIAAAMDNYLRAFDVRSGKELWKGRLPAGGQATPMTYAWGGRQYVVVAAGGNARSGTTLGDQVVAFALP
ncbi:pyrroloquinoline quinone-dependent dehydrogenase [Phenylobacterium sp.]|uniref:pyrroloquinoline quinone-dependent dehydrogenase n=1 Tax=Phenylobacterium sp. TaxID=1871053 RepID=UPI00301CC8D9